MASFWIFKNSGFKVIALYTDTYSIQCTGSVVSDNGGSIVCIVVLSSAMLLLVSTNEFCRFMVIIIFAATYSMYHGTLIRTLV